MKIDMIRQSSRFSGCTTLCMIMAIAVAASLFIGAQASARTPRTQPEATADDGSSLSLARALRAAGDARSAVQIYRRLATRTNAPADLQLELGETLMEAGLVDEAIGILSKISLDTPSAALAQLGLARAQLRLDQPSQALGYIERAAALAPANEPILVARGVVYDRLNRHIEAQNAYRAALVIAPRSIAARNDLALSLALVGQYDEAIAILTPIARSADASPIERQNLAFILGLRGDGSAALQLGRVDLDEATAQANAKFFAFARSATP